MTDLPHFPFWVKDFQAATQDWTDEEVGAYLRLLMHQWNRGEIPNDRPRLNRICDSLERTWPTVGEKFKGQRNTRMEQVRREAIEKHKNAVEKAKVAAAARWQDESSEDATSNAPSNAQAMPTKTKARTKNQSAKPKAKKEAGARAVPVPDVLLTHNGFTEKWAEWLEYRQAKRKPVSEIAAKKQLKKLAENPSTASAAIDQAIASDWQGLFPDKQRRAAKEPEAIDWSKEEGVRIQ